MIGRAILLALAPALVSAAVLTSGAAPAAPLAPISATLWQPRVGDVVLLAAEDLVGRQIREASGAGATFAHVGLVVRHGGRLVMVESTPFGTGTVAFTPIETFTTDPETTELMILRPRGRLDVERMNAQAERLVAARIPFDYRFDAEDQSRLYCAELVHNLLRDAGLDLSRIRRVPMHIPFTGEQHVIPPDAFAHADGLTELFRRRNAAP